MLTADNKQVRISETTYMVALQLTEDMFKRG